MTEQSKQILDGLNGLNEVTKNLFPHFDDEQKKEILDCYVANLTKVCETLAELEDNYLEIDAELQLYKKMHDLNVSTIEEQRVAMDTGTEAMVKANEQIEFNNEVFEALEVVIDFIEEGETFISYDPQSRTYMIETKEGIVLSDSKQHLHNAVLDAKEALENG